MFEKTNLILYSTELGYEYFNCCHPCSFNTVHKTRDTCCWQPVDTFCGDAQDDSSQLKKVMLICVQNIVLGGGNTSLQSLDWIGGSILS
jgi:hypothetical protein